MDKVFSKYKRGDVWYVKLNSEFGDGNDNSSVQKKSRPYLIVSCEENNNSSTIFNVIPICTRQFDHLPMHVYFRNCNRDQIVLCEQITTLSVIDFQRPESHYLYSFNLDFMNKVDNAIAGQLGLKTRVVDLNILETLIDKISKEKEEELKKKYEQSIESRIEEIAARLAKKFGVSIRSEDIITGRIYNNPDLEYAPVEVVESMKKISSERLCKDKDSSLERTIENEKQLKTNDVKVVRKKMRWDKISMEEFLKDKESMSLSSLAEKYCISKKSIYSMASLFKKKLKEEN